MALTTEEGLERLGGSMRAKLDQFIQDRLPAETQWMKNLRQYRRIYDPEAEKLIGEGQSKAYPGHTRVKVKAFVAKMMEMMFPAKDVNFLIQPTPIPSIPTKDLQSIVDRLVEEAAAQVSEENPTPPEVTDEQIEEAIRELASTRASKMEERIIDQLMDPITNYPRLCKRVVRSGAIYGLGIARSPMVRMLKQRTFKRDPITNTAIPIEKNEPRPYPDFVKIWDAYPDFSASDWDDQEGFFERMVFSRPKFTALKTHDAGFMAEAIDEYLKTHQSGNYKPQSYEADIRSMNGISGSASADGRRYEVFRYYGSVSAHDLAAAGVDIRPEDTGKSMMADIWFIDNVIIKADIAPFGTKVSDMYHAFVYAEDEEAGITGVGLPVDVRDSQMELCSGTRALWDNIATIAGPSAEIAVDLLKRNSPKTIGSHTVYEREGEGPDLAFPAIRPIQFNSHVSDILATLKNSEARHDMESNLPNYLLGQTQGLGEAFRTTGNMSQMTGGANMVTKDSVRAFDLFTESLVGSFLAWNMEFGPDDCKGDFEAKGKGNISLVAKEVRGAALAQWKTTLTPRQQVLIKDEQLLVEEAKSRDLPTDIILQGKDAEEALARYDQGVAAAQQAEQGLTAAKTGKLAADAEHSKVKAQSDAAMIEPKIAQILALITSAEKETGVKEQKLKLETVKEMVAQLGGNDVQGA